MKKDTVVFIITILLAMAAFVGLLWVSDPKNRDLDLEFDDTVNSELNLGFSDSDETIAVVHYNQEDFSGENGSNYEVFTFNKGDYNITYHLIDLEGRLSEEYELATEGDFTRSSFRGKDYNVDYYLIKGKKDNLYNYKMAGYVKLDTAYLEVVVEYKTEYNIKSEKFVPILSTLFNNVDI